MGRAQVSCELVQRVASDEDADWDIDDAVLGVDSSMTARRRAASPSPKTSWRLRFSSSGILSESTSPSFVAPTQLRDHAIDRLPSSNSLEREFAQELRRTPLARTNSAESRGERWRSLHIDSMREVRLTAGPMTVKSSRASPPMLPYITSPTCNARP